MMINKCQLIMSINYDDSLNSLRLRDDFSLVHMCYDYRFDMLLRIHWQLKAHNSPS